MNSSELKEFLKAFHIPTDAYSILERPKDESLVFARENNKWIVYYYERRQRTQEMSFEDEIDASANFLERIKAWFK